MKKKCLISFFIPLMVFLSSNGWSQDTAQYKDPFYLPISIRAVRITQYEESPLQIEGQMKWSKGIWKWIIGKSIFVDSIGIGEKKIEGNAIVKDICKGDGIVDIVVSIDSILYEVITIANLEERKGLKTIEIGKKYNLSLFPYYNYPYTMAYHRNTPIFLNGYVVWINRRKLDSNIYLCPDLDGIFYCPADDAEKKIIESVHYNNENR